VDTEPSDARPGAEPQAIASVPGRGEPTAIPMTASSHHRAASLRRRRRALVSIIVIALVLVIGTLGFEGFTGAGWVNAFYFECMLATGQGPPFSLKTDAAKLFASAMAFVSVGTVFTTLLLNIGPLVGRIWREGIEAAEREIRRWEGGVEGGPRGGHPPGPERRP
jgi:hypothetical protein